MTLEMCQMSRPSSQTAVIERKVVAMGVSILCGGVGRVFFFFFLFMTFCVSLV
jgi:hypothetical protein